MKVIPLNKGMIALVDDQDFGMLSKYKWSVKNRKGSNIYYARCYIGYINKKTVKAEMHRMIMNPPKGIEVDHRDMDGLNNRRSNLRMCSKAENGRNRGKSKSSTSGYKGVTLDKRFNRWYSHITVNKELIYLGCFLTKEEAYAAYCTAATKYHGEFAHF